MKKKWIIFIVSVLLIALIFALLLYSGVFDKKESKEASPTVTISATPTQQPTVTPTPTPIPMPTPTPKTEYTIEEIEKEYLKIKTLIHEETKYLTSDELATLNASTIEKFISQTSLSNGTKISIRGKVFSHTFFNDGLCIYLASEEAIDKHNSSDDDFDYENFFAVYCFFGDNFSPSFLEEGENIFINGTFNNFMMTDCNLISPAIEIEEYKNNIADVVNEISNEIWRNFYNEHIYIDKLKIFGTVEGVFPITDEQQKNTFLESFPCSNYHEFSMFETYAKISSHVVMLTDENKEYPFFYFINYAPQVGDKMMIESYVYAERWSEESVVLFGDANFEKAYIYH